MFLQKLAKITLPLETNYYGIVIRFTEIL